MDIPYTKSLVSSMCPEVLYTDNNGVNNDTDADTNNNDDNAAKLHYLSLPLAKSAIK